MKDKKEKTVKEEGKPCKCRKGFKAKGREEKSRLKID